MRLFFLGSGDFGLPTLAWLCEHHDVVAVISQPDRPAGRHRHLQPTPVAAWAASQNLPVHKTNNVNDPAFIELLRASGGEAGIIIAFGQKLSPPLLDALGGLAVNLHASLLPKYRGAAPINWAMMRGETETGVSVIGLAQKMDAGPIYATASRPIDPSETAGELHDRLAELGPRVIGQVLDDFAHDRLDPRSQDDSLATVAPKLSKADGTVDFAQSAFAVRARIHGLTPWPGCRVQWHSQATGQATPLTLCRVADTSTTMDIAAAPGTILPEFHVATTSGTIRLIEVQAPGTRPMPVSDFARGHPLSPGDRLSPYRS